MLHHQRIQCGQEANPPPREMTVVPCLLLVPAAGALAGRKARGAQAWVSSPPVVPQQVSQWSDLTSPVKGEEWIPQRPKGDNESDETGWL